LAGTIFPGVRTYLRIHSCIIQPATHFSSASRFRNLLSSRRSGEGIPIDGRDAGRGPRYDFEQTRIDVRREKVGVKDILFLLEADFHDPAFPDQTFFCWHCALLEGVVGYYPDLARHILVQRISWPRPRQPVIDLLGDAHQNLPVLVIGDGRHSPWATGTAHGRDFIADKAAILHELHAHYGIAVPHP
jgi:hypothetical protein